MNFKIPSRPGWLVGGIAAALIVEFWMAADGFTPAQSTAAAIALLMGWLWFTQALPLSLTSLIPLPLFPLFGVQPFSSTILGYLNPYIWLFAGGMVVGAAMSHTGLSRRLALAIMHVVGSSPGRLLLGILTASALVSMWISNTATAIMMITIVLALLRQVKTPESGGPLSRFGAAAVLAVAYGSNVGGIGTKIGTPPNSFMVNHLSGSLGMHLSFVDYLPVGIPFMLLFLPVTWLVLWLYARREGREVAATFARVLEQERGALGPIGPSERVVAATFGLAALLWITGDIVRPAIADALGMTIQSAWYEASVALAAAACVLLTRSVPIRGLMQGESRVEWSVLVLLGGGYVLASGIEKSGLGALMGPVIAGVAGTSLLRQLALASFATVLLTAFVANTAALVLLTALLPQVPAVLLTATMASSMDFALVYGTPPNTIAWGSKYVTASQMFALGIVLDVLAATLLVPYGFYLNMLLGG